MAMKNIVELPVRSLKPHPKANIIPPLTPDEFAGLTRDIEQRGIQTPLLVTAQRVVLAGHHRLQIAGQLGLKTVPAIILSKLSKAEELTHLVLDNIHRRHLSASQRAAIATMPGVADAIIKVYRDEAKARQIAAGVHGSRGGRGRARTLVAPKAQGSRAPTTRDRVGALAGVGGKTIDHAVFAWTRAPDRMKAIIQGSTAETVSQLAHDIRRCAKRSEQERAVRKGVEEFEQVFKLHLFDIWAFKSLDPGFGKRWPGNIPAALVANAVYYFTEPGDLVVDPMAGGGVTGDVCRALGRPCLMGDLKPSSTKIRKHRIERGPLPNTKSKAALVFLDPPYWSLKSERYDDEAASGLPWPEWCQWLKAMSKSAAAMTTTGGYVTCLMQDPLTRSVERFQSGRSSIFEAMKALTQAGLQPVTMIACPLSTQQSSKYDVEWARRERRLLGINRQLLVFRK